MTEQRRSARTRSEPATSSFAVLVAAYAVLLVLPSELVLVGPLRSNGSPVRLLGLLSFFLVVAAFLQWGERRHVRPVAVVLLVYLAARVFAWGTAYRWSLDAEASAQVNRDVLALVSATGIALLCTFVVASLHRAQVLVGCLVGGGVVCAVAGMLQAAGIVVAWADVVALPFTTTVVPPSGLNERLGLVRVSGSTSHPIEYAVCLALLLPLAVHLSIHARTRGARRMSSGAAAMMLLSFPLGLSRAGLIAVVVCLLVYSAFLPRRHRVGLVGGAALAVAVAVVAVPQVTGAFSEMIFGAGEDNSVTGRLGDYPRVFEQVGRAPWLGGAPKDISVAHTVLDNQWLVALVNSGVLGVAALALLFFGTAAVAIRASRREAAGSAARSLNGAIASCLIAAGVTAGTFDFLAFQQVTFLVFLTAALIGVRGGESLEGGPAPARAAT